MSTEFTPAPLDADPLIGQVLGGSYEITGLLGAGGMGNVYAAKHTRLPRKFAIKVVKADLARDMAAFERFKREAEISSSLGNRHIVQVIDFHTLDNGSPYIVMEFLSGEDLSTKLERQGRLTLEETQHILSQVVSALDAAHARGIVHRDIKPENIFLSRTDDEVDFVKLLDFGLSKMRGSSKRLTANLSVLGTPWYMSPEQARGDADLDHRTDIYALGVVLFQVLSGRVPFEGENVYNVLTMIATQPPPSLLEFAPDVPPGLERVVMKALAKRPQDRYSSAGELWADAELVFQGMAAPFPSRSTGANTALATGPDGRPMRVPTPRGVPAAPAKVDPFAPTTMRAAITDADLAERASRSAAPRVDPLDRTMPSLANEVPPPSRARGLSGGRKVSRDSMPPAPAKHSPGFLIGLGFAGTLALGLLVWVGTHLGGKKPDPVEPLVPVVNKVNVPIVVPPKPPEPVKPTVARAKLSLELDPADAVVTQAGKPVTLPLEVDVGSEPVALEVTAPKHVAQKVTWTPKADEKLKVVLEPEPEPKVTPKGDPKPKNPKGKPNNGMFVEP